MNIDIKAKPGSTASNKTGGWRTYRPNFDYEKCISCGTCSRICPEGIIKMEKNDLSKDVPVADYDFCKGCGLCANECPAKAIDMQFDK